MNDLPDLPIYGFEPNLGGLLGLLLTVVLPVAVGLLTKQSWSAGVKGTLLLALSAVKVIVEGALEAQNTGVPFEVWSVVYSTVINFGIAVLVYFGLLRGTSLMASAQRSGVSDKPTA